MRHTTTFSLLGALSILSLVCVAGCSSAVEAGGDNNDPASSDEDLRSKKNRLNLVVSVDWEGDDLEESNLAAMEEFRNAFPAIPLVHFLNAAYFEKPGAKAADVAARMRRVIRPGDELGLHVHGWKRLFEAAGVKFREGPTFIGYSFPMDDCSLDCGHEVPISHYTTEELRKVVRYSIDKLNANGFGKAETFRCGGWIAKDNVRAAIVAEGMTRDNSAVSTKYLRDNSQRMSPLWNWLDETWPGQTNATQPYLIPTTFGNLLEIPDNGGLADYITLDDLVEVYTANRDLKFSDQKKEITINTGFHQETAARYLPGLSLALKKIIAQAQADKVELRPLVTGKLPIPAAK